MLRLSTTPISNGRLKLIASWISRTKTSFSKVFLWFSRTQETRLFVRFPWNSARESSRRKPLKSRLRIGKPPADHGSRKVAALDRILSDEIHPGSKRSFLMEGSIQAQPPFRVTYEIRAENSETVLQIS